MGAEIRAHVTGHLNGARSPSNGDLSGADTINVVVCLSKGGAKELLREEV